MNIYKTVYRFVISYAKTNRVSPEYSTQEECFTAMLRCMEWARDKGHNSITVRTWSQTWCVGKTNDTASNDNTTEVAPF